MAKRLIQLHIEHVAGVDRPANKRKFLVIKSEQIEKLSVVKEGDKYCVYDGDKKIGSYATEEAARAAMANMKSEKGATMLTQEQIVRIAEKDTQVAVLKQREELIESQNKVKSLEEEIEKLKAAHPPAEANPDEEEFWKGVPAVVRNRYESEKKRGEEAQKAAKEQKDRNETAEWVGKLAKVSYVPIIAERFAPIMKAIAETHPKEAKEVEGVFVACHEIIGKGAIIFKEIGMGGSSEGDATDIVSRVQLMAKEIEKRDKVSNDTAIQRVFAEHPEWYSPYRKRSTVGVGTVNA
jgi:hypothetical protein